MARATNKKQSVRLRAFAKINLCLHYHELRTIFQAISLHDSLELSITPALQLCKVGLSLERRNFAWVRRILCRARLMP
jgi:4-diphosphocytidyl-2C-methyl-D-erythritol kinase